MSREWLSEMAPHFYQFKATQREAGVATSIEGQRGEGEAVHDEHARKQQRRS